MSISSNDQADYISGSLDDSNVDDLLMSQDNTNEDINEYYNTDNKDELQPTNSHSFHMKEDEDEDVYYHEYILKDLVSDASKKIHDHMFRIKIRMELDKQQEIDKIHQYYSEILSQNESTISALEAKLIESENINKIQVDRHQKELETSKSLFEKALKVQELRISFMKWTNSTDDVKVEKDLNSLSEAVNEQNQKNKEYLTKVHENHQTEIESLKTSMSLHMDTITRDMIEKYEAEIYILSKDLSTARQQAHNERILRQQLEDELRQMFLKNMTSMNIEAFRIFQQVQISREAMESSSQQNAAVASQEKEYSKDLEINNNSSTSNNIQKNRTSPSVNSRTRVDSFEVFDIADIHNTKSKSKSLTSRTARGVNGTIKLTQPRRK